MSLEIVLILLGGAVGGFVSGAAGFAFSMTALVFWAAVLEPKAAASLAVVMALVSQLASWWFGRINLFVKALLPLLAGGLVGIPIGWALLEAVDRDTFRLVIGATVLVYCAFRLLVEVTPLPDTPRFLAGDAAAGLLGGILGGLAGMSGVVPIIWAGLRAWKKGEARAVIQGFNLFSHSVATSLYVATGTIHAIDWRIILAVCPVVIAAAFSGVRVYHRMNERAFKRTVLVLLAVAGLLTVAQALA